MGAILQKRIYYASSNSSVPWRVCFTLQTISSYTNAYTANAARNLGPNETTTTQYPYNSSIRVASTGCDIEFCVDRMLALL
jgi:hypothetical protein